MKKVMDAKKHFIITRDGIGVKCAHEKAYFTHGKSFNLGPIYFKPCANCYSRIEGKVLSDIIIDSLGRCIHNDSGLNKIKISAKGGKK